MVGVIINYMEGKGGWAGLILLCESHLGLEWALGVHVHGGGPRSCRRFVLCACAFLGFGMALRVQALGMQVALGDRLGFVNIKGAPGN